MAKCNNIVNDLLELKLNIIDENNNQYNFESFIINNIPDINDLLGIQSNFYGYAIEINLIENWKLKENSIICKKISNDELFIEFQLNIDIEGYIGKFSVGSGKLNMEINMTYNTGLNLITSIAIDSVDILEPFDSGEIYNAEYSFHEEFY